MRKALLGIKGVVAVELSEQVMAMDVVLWVHESFAGSDTVGKTIHTHRSGVYHTKGDTALIFKDCTGRYIQERATIHTLEEGCICPECNIGELAISQEPCYCSATSHPPCSSCEHSIVACDNCEITLEEILDNKEESGSMAIPKVEVKTFMSGVLSESFDAWSNLSDKTAQNLSNQKEETKMTQLNRKQVTVTLIDNDSNLPANKAMVFTKDIISDGSKEDIIREVLFSENIVEALFTHNKVRKTITDEGILGRVGNEVKLRAVELKDLTWNVA